MLNLLISFEDEHDIERLLYGEPDPWLRLFECRHWAAYAHYHQPDDPDYHGYGGLDPALAAEQRDEIAEGHDTHEDRRAETLRRREEEEARRQQEREERSEAERRAGEAAAQARQDALDSGRSSSDAERAAMQARGVAEADYLAALRDNTPERVEERRQEQENEAALEAAFEEERERRRATVEAAEAYRRGTGSREDWEAARAAEAEGKQEWLAARLAYGGRISDSLRATIAEYQTADAANLERVRQTQARYESLAVEFDQAAREFEAGRMSQAELQQLRDSLDQAKRAWESARAEYDQGRDSWELLRSALSARGSSGIRSDQSQGPLDGELKATYDSANAAFEEAQAAARAAEETYNAGTGTLPQLEAAVARKREAAEELDRAFSEWNTAGRPIGALEQVSTAADEGDVDELRAIASSERGSMRITYTDAEGVQRQTTLAEYIRGTLIPNTEQRLTVGDTNTEIQDILSEVDTGDVAALEAIASDPERANLPVTIYATDDDGNRIQATNPDGTPQVDADDNPVYQTETVTMAQHIRDTLIPNTEQRLAVDAANAGLNEIQDILSEVDSGDAAALEAIANDPERADLPVNVYATDENGERIPRVDDEGNPVLDADGNPVYQTETVTMAQHIREHVIPQAQGQLARDTIAQIQDILSEVDTGDTAALEAIASDPERANLPVTIYGTDENGERIPRVGENGEPVLDADGNPVYQTETVTMAQYIRDTLIPNTEQRLAVDTPAPLPSDSGQRLTGEDAAKELQELEAERNQLAAGFTEEQEQWERDKEQWIRDGRPEDVRLELNARNRELHRRGEEIRQISTRLSALGHPEYSHYAVAPAGSGLTPEPIAAPPDSLHSPTSPDLNTLSDPQSQLLALGRAAELERLEALVAREGPRPAWVQRIAELRGDTPVQLTPTQPPSRSAAEPPTPDVFLDAAGRGLTAEDAAERYGLIAPGQSVTEYAEQHGLTVATAFQGQADVRATEGIPTSPPVEVSAPGPVNIGVANSRLEVPPVGQALTFEQAVLLGDAGYAGRVVESVRAVEGGGGLRMVRLGAASDTVGSEERLAVVGEAEATGAAITEINDILAGGIQGDDRYRLAALSNDPGRASLPLFIPDGSGGGRQTTVGAYAGELLAEHDNRPRTSLELLEERREQAVSDWNADGVEMHISWGDYARAAGALAEIKDRERRRQLQDRLEQSRAEHPDGVKGAQLKALEERYASFVPQDSYRWRPRRGTEAYRARRAMQRMRDQRRDEQRNHSLNLQSLHQAYNQRGTHITEQDARRAEAAGRISEKRRLEAERLTAIQNIPRQEPETVSQETQQAADLASLGRTSAPSQARVAADIGAQNRDFVNFYLGEDTVPDGTRPTQEQIRQASAVATDVGSLDRTSAPSQARVAADIGAQNRDFVNFYLGEDTVPDGTRPTQEQIRQASEVATDVGSLDRTSAPSQARVAADIGAQNRDFVNFYLGEDTVPDGTRPTQAQIQQASEVATQEIARPEYLVGVTGGAGGDMEAQAREDLRRANLVGVTGGAGGDIESVAPTAEDLRIAELEERISTSPIADYGTGSFSDTVLGETAIINERHPDWDEYNRLRIQRDGPHWQREAIADQTQAFLDSTTIATVDVGPAWDASRALATGRHVSNYDSEIPVAANIGLLPVVGTLTDLNVRGRDGYSRGDIAWLAGQGALDVLPLPAAGTLARAPARTLIRGRDLVDVARGTRLPGVSLYSGGRPIPVGWRNYVPPRPSFSLTPNINPYVDVVSGSGRVRPGGALKTPGHVMGELVQPGGQYQYLRQVNPDVVPGPEMAPFYERTLREPITDGVMSQADTSRAVLDVVAADYGRTGRPRTLSFTVRNPETQALEVLQVEHVPSPVAQVVGERTGAGIGFHSSPFAREVVGSPTDDLSMLGDIGSVHSVQPSTTQTTVVGRTGEVYEIDVPLKVQEGRPMPAQEQAGFAAPAVATEGYTLQSAAGAGQGARPGHGVIPVDPRSNELLPSASRPASSYSEVETISPIPSQWRIGRDLPEGEIAAIRQRASELHPNDPAQATKSADAEILLRETGEMRGSEQGPTRYFNSAELKSALGDTRPSASVMIYDPSQGAVLMVQGAYGQGRRGKWQSAGGLIDPGETPQTAAVREALEETGVTADVRAKIGEDNRVNHHVFAAEYSGGTPRVTQPHETLDVKWVPYDDVKNLDLSFPTEELEALRRLREYQQSGRQPDLPETPPPPVVEADLTGRQVTNDYSDILPQSVATAREIPIGVGTRRPGERLGETVQPTYYDVHNMTPAEVRRAAMMGFRQWVRDPFGRYRLTREGSFDTAYGVTRMDPADYARAVAEGQLPRPDRHFGPRPVSGASDEGFDAAAASRRTRDELDDEGLRRLDDATFEVPLQRTPAQDVIRTSLQEEVGSDEGDVQRRTEDNRDRSRSRAGDNRRPAAGVEFDGQNLTSPSRFPEAQLRTPQADTHRTPPGEPPRAPELQQRTTTEVPIRTPTIGTPRRPPGQPPRTPESRPQRGSELGRLPSPEAPPRTPPTDTPRTPPGDTPRTPPTDTPRTPPGDTPRTPPTDTPRTPPTDTPRTPPTDTPRTPPTDTPRTPPTDTPRTPPTDTPRTPPTDTPRTPPTDTPAHAAHPTPPGRRRAILRASRPALASPLAPASRPGTGIVPPGTPPDDPPSRPPGYPPRRDPDPDPDVSRLAIPDPEDVEPGLHPREITHYDVTKTTTDLVTGEQTIAPVEHVSISTAEVTRVFARGSRRQRPPVRSTGHRAQGRSRAAGVGHAPTRRQTA